METLISVLLPSRGRPVLLPRVCQSLWSNARHPEQVEIVVRLDEDDQTQAPPGTIELRGPRIGYKRLHDMYLECALAAKGRWLWMMNDDCIVQQPNWDDTVVAHDRNHEFSVLHAHSCLPIFPRRWVDILGIVARSQQADSYIWNTAERAGVPVIGPGIEVLHDQFDLTGNNRDQTFLEREYDTGYFKPANQRMIDNDAAKLRIALGKQTKQMLTLCYITNRREPRAEWFFDSLAQQTGHLGIRLVLVDFFADEPGRREDMARKAGHHWDFVHVPPKPTVWQGKHRLTTRDYFAAANARNTGLCLAPDGWIAYADDLSVLTPGWLDRVRLAMEYPKRITAGAYQKVCELNVHQGEIVSYKDHPQGHDSRWAWGDPVQPVVIGGGSLFGCSLVGPVEAFLSINGWDEDCDSMGGEDSICGLMLERAGYSIVYDRQMMTLESEEGHHREPSHGATRIIKMKPTDASWAMLRAVLNNGRHTAPNYFGSAGIRGLRQRVLAGEPFPISYIPEHDWRDSQPLREM